MKVKSISEKERDEYYLLTEKLEEIDWALEGMCNDIDCDKYIYKNLLKKKYNPTLKHSFSCLKSLRRNREAVMRLLSLSRFQKFRYITCTVCKKQLDKLSKKSTLVSFTRRSSYHEKYYEIDLVWVHKKCRKAVKIPKGWSKF